MATNLEARLEINADASQARTEIGRLEDSFSKTLRDLGKSKGEIAAFRKLGRNAEENANEIEQLDDELRGLVTTYSRLRREAADRDMLGIGRINKAEKEIERLRQAYERLRQTGTASQRDLAIASRTLNNRVAALQSQLSQGAGTNSFIAGLSRIRFAILGATAAVGGLISGTKSILESTDKIGKQADKVGVTTDALQALRFAAEQSGVEARTLDMAIQRFSRRVGEAANGTGELKNDLQRLGIAVKDSNGNIRSTESILYDYADAIKEAGSSQEQLRLAFKGFDSEGAALVNTFRQGASALKAQISEAKSTGKVIDEYLIRRAETLNSEWDALTTTISTKFKSAVVGIANLFTGKTPLEKGIESTKENLDIAARYVEQLREKMIRLQQTKPPNWEEELEGTANAINTQMKLVVKYTKQLDGEMQQLRGNGQQAADGQLGAWARLKDVVRSAKDETQSFSEIQKLLKKESEDVFKNAETDSAKYLRTLDLLTQAEGARKRGSADAAAQAERAARAINQLGESTEIDPYEIDQFKDRLRELVDETSKPVQWKMQPVVDLGQMGTVEFQKNLIDELGQMQIPVQVVATGIEDFRQALDLALSGYTVNVDVNRVLDSDAIARDIAKSGGRP